MNINEAILPLARAFEDAGIPYAFGGAFAFGYHAQPRATTDIDINVFVSEHAAAPVLSVLTPLGISIQPERDLSLIERDGQIRLSWDQIMVDLFFMNFSFLESSRDRIWLVPFAGRTIPILSAEDLIVCKVAFNREKDWLDLKEVAAIQRDRLDLQYIRHWLTEILGTEDSRIDRFEDLVASYIP